MLIRTSGVPELRDLSSDRRQRVLEAAVNASFWSLPSLAIVTLLTVAGGATVLVTASQGLLGIFMPALVTFGGAFLYRLIGINSFLRPAIRSFCETDLPVRVVKRADPVEFYFIGCFVICVFVGLFMMLW